MKIICGVHGGQSGIEISPDLLPLLKDMESTKATFKRVRFLFEDEAYWDTVLSQEFCRKHAIPYQDEVLATEEEPYWSKELAAACGLCVEERLEMKL
jgi:hypothetical protein